MSRFVKIPVELVKDFRGKVLKTPLLDNDLEVVYKLIQCPSPECEFTTTSLEDIRTHVEEHPPEVSQMSFQLNAELVDSSNAHMLLQLLTTLNTPEGTLSKSRRAADSFHCSEVWKRVWYAIQHDTEFIKLHKDQYRWLKDLFDRKILEKGVEAENLQTVASAMFGLSWHGVIQTFLIPSEREDDVEELEEVENLPTPMPQPVEEAKDAS
jgi:hypothetical protein|tara:strand:+ start:649 stop:1278 length:630 start_codon:yes stop_codon:yes gene_type:complete